MVFQDSQVSIFWFLLVWDLCAGGQHVVNFFPFEGFSICKTTPRYGSEYDYELLRNDMSLTLFFG